MELQRWERIQEVFHAARGRGDDSRAAFLDMACGLDSVLRAEVEELLSADARTTSFRNCTRAGARADPVSEAGAAPIRGQRIGRYDLVREIGHGGMGTVYEAVQENPRRTVALKVMRVGFPSHAALQRFAHEAQFLGWLHHAAIAQIFEAGFAAGESGLALQAPQPYYAMEFVPAAQTIVRYGQIEKLNVRQRLALFAIVCDAVQHAHQIGIIHRDLKPANILVDGSGNPKIIDFGVARLIDADVMPATLQTSTGQILGTLPYMSPEQCRGDARRADTRSDVYALGVVLFELLSGELPYDLAGKSMPESIRTIGEDDPRRLSSTKNSFRGDLDTIVAKALDKDPNRRYASAAELAGDIDHYLRDEPIVARPATALYQFRKFARRNKTLVGGAAAVLAVSVLGFAISTFLYFSEQAARRAASEQANIAEKRAVEAEQARRSAEYRSYVASIAAASHALRMYDAAAARRSLEQAPENLRGWEWRHFARRLDRSSRTIPAHGAAIRALAVSPDGAWLASASQDHWIKLWHVATGKPVGRPGELPDWALCVAFSPDGTRLASGDSGGCLRIQELGGDAFTELIAHAGWVSALSFFPDGRLLATAGQDGYVKIWDARNGGPVRTFNADGEQVLAVAVSPDGRRVASGSYAGRVRLWDAWTGDPIGQVLGHDKAVRAISFSPDGSLLATGSHDWTIRIWDGQTGDLLGVLVGHTSPVASIAFSPDGQRISSGSYDRTVRVWDARCCERIGTLPGHTSVVWAVAWSVDGLRIISGSGDRTLKYWEPSAQDIISIPGHARDVRAVAFSPDGRRLASAGGDVFTNEDTTIRIWAVETRALVTEPDAHRKPVNAMDFSSDGTRMVSASNDGVICVWDTNSWSRIWLSEPSQAVNDVEFSPDGTTIASASKDGTVRLWQALTGVPLGQPLRHGQAVSSASFSPDGSRLVSVSFDKSVRLWDPFTGADLGQLGSLSAPAYCVRFSPDSRRLALGLTDGKIVLLNSHSANRMVQLVGHTGSVRAVAFSPDGARLASASFDYSIMVWDVETGQPIATLHGHSREAIDVEFSPDGNWLASGGREGELKLWDAVSP